MTLPADRLMHCSVSCNMVYLTASEPQGHLLWFFVNVKERVPVNPAAFSFLHLMCTTRLRNQASPQPPDADMMIFT